MGKHQLRLAWNGNGRRKKKKMQQTWTILHGLGAESQKIPANKPGASTNRTHRAARWRGAKTGMQTPVARPDPPPTAHRIARPTPHPAVGPGSAPPSTPPRRHHCYRHGSSPPPPPPDVLDPLHRLRHPSLPCSPALPVPPCLAAVTPSPFQPRPSLFACTMPAALTSAAMTDDGGPSAEELRREFGPNLPDDVLYECTFRVASPWWLLAPVGSSLFPAARPPARLSTRSLVCPTSGGGGGGSSCRPGCGAAPAAAAAAPSPPLLRRRLLRW